MDDFRRNRHALTAMFDRFLANIGLVRRVRYIHLANEKGKIKKELSVANNQLEMYRTPPDEIPKRTKLKIVKKHYEKDR